MIHKLKDKATKVELDSSRALKEKMKQDPEFTIKMLLKAKKAFSEGCIRSGREILNECIEGMEAMAEENVEEVVEDVIEWDHRINNGRLIGSVCGEDVYGIGCDGHMFRYELSHVLSNQLQTPRNFLKVRLYDNSSPH